MPQRDFSAVEKTAEALLDQEGFELVDFTAGGHGSKALLQFFVDRKQGNVTLEDCEKLSSKISAAIDMENLVDSAYIIEVSSPGVDRVLKKPAHFARFKGERVRVQLKMKVDNRAVYTGLIAESDDKTVTVDDGTTKFVFKYEDIKQARLDPVVEF